MLVKVHTVAIKSIAQPPCAPSKLIQRLQNTLYRAKYVLKFELHEYIIRPE